jgi:hypothetical protein
VLLWMGAPVGDDVPLLGLTPEAIVSGMVPETEVDALVEDGPASVTRRWPTIVRLDAVDRIRTDGDADLRVESRGEDPDIRVRFLTPHDRDEAFSDLHRLLAPQAPLVQLRRPVRHFLEIAAGGACVLALALGVPWAVEAGHIDRAQWLVATAFNVLGPTGFRYLGVGIAALCLVGLMTMAVNNRASPGFRLREPT